MRAYACIVECTQPDAVLERRGFAEFGKVW